MTAILRLTDGTTTIDLIKNATEYGFHLESWRPNTPFYKGGGTFQESSLSWGRQLVDKQFENHIDTFSLKANQTSQDALIRELQDIRRLLEKASSYWTTDWQNEPVWLEAQASNETNLRYALVVLGRIPEDENPYNQPFLQPGCYSVMDGLTLVIEHQAWTDTEPGVGTCVPIAGYGTFCPLCAIEFDGADTSLSIPDNAAIQDLHDAAMTVEAWIKPASSGESSAGNIFTKGPTNGWLFRLAGGTPTDSCALFARINCVTTDGDSTSTSLSVLYDEWSHVAMTWDDASYNYPRMWVNGEEVTYSVTNNRNGAITSDVGIVAYIGAIGVSQVFDGLIGWTRISDAVRYNATFTPPSQCTLPEIDANTVGQWIGAECSGATIDNQEGTAAIDGTLADGDFECDCEVVYGNVVSCGPSYLEIPSVEGYVKVTDNATIQDLHDGAMTLEIWYRPYGLAGSNNSNNLFSKHGSNLGWVLDHIDGGVGGAIRAVIECATTDAIAYAFPISATSGEWMHVAMTWDDASYDYPNIWINGQLQINNSQTRVGAIQTDVGIDLDICGNSGDTAYADYGWARISDVVRYTANFTPPERCELPEVDANTVLLEIYEGQGDTTYDLSGNGNDGAITLATWGCGCQIVEEDGLGNELDVGDINHTCSDNVYLTNKHSYSGLTHIFVDDGGVYSANLIHSTHHLLLPSVPVANDAVYFGAESISEIGPFTNLVFNIGVAQTGGCTTTWEYYQGAPTSGWSTLGVCDSTRATANRSFSATGRGEVAWLPLTSAVNGDWTTTAVNGVTAYWVRCRVTNVSSPPATAPIQSGDEVYTVTWPFVDVQAAGVPGDIIALARSITTRECDYYSKNRFLCGLRSMSRGEDFTAYLNISEIQEPSGYSAVDMFGSFTADVRAPTGECLVGTLAFATSTTAAMLVIDETLADQYTGKYHVFLRASSKNATPTDDYVFLYVNYGGLQFDLMTTKTKRFVSDNDTEIFDFGRLDIPQFAGNQSSGLYFFVGIGTDDAAGTTIHLYDLILIPVDEFAFEISPTTKTDSASSFDVLDMDSISNPKSKLIGLNRAISDDTIFYIYKTASSRSEMMLQSNSHQRLWTFAMGWDSTDGVWCSHIDFIAQEELYRQSRYLSMRGSR